MITLPRIEGDAREALSRVERARCPGRTELLSLARLDSPEKLAAAVKPLLDSGIVSASGNAIDPSRFFPPILIFAFGSSTDPLYSCPILTAGGLG